MLWSGLLRGGSNKDHNKCLVIHGKPRMLLWGHGVCVYVGYNIFFLKKKKSFEIITASFNTAHIDWSGIGIIYWCKWIQY